MKCAIVILKELIAIVGDGESMCVKWLVFLIGSLYLIGVQFGEDQRTNIIEITCLKKKNWTSTSNINNHSNFNNDHDLFIQLKNHTNMHFQLNVPKSGEVSISTRLLQMF